jgi:hypothetical protein
MKLENILVGGGAYALLLAALGACQSETAVGATTPTSAYFVASAQASKIIADARCHHAVDCVQVGPGREYESFDACMGDLHHDTDIALRAQKCPYGVYQDRLTSCLNDIYVAKCGDTDDTEHLATCRSESLCR